MRARRAALAFLAIGGLLSAGCGEKEVATEHIRSVIASAEEAGSARRAPADSTAAMDTTEATGGSPLLRLPNGDTLTIRPAVVDFYRERGFKPAWTDDDEILAQGMSVLEAIGLAGTEGLDPERYHFSTAREMARLLGEDAVEDREMEYLGNLDLLLTESFVRLAQDLTGGTMDPTRAGLDWEIEREMADDRKLIDRVVAGDDPKSVLGSVRPRVPYYDRMIRGLGQLRKVAEAGGWPGVPEGETLAPGDEDPRVGAIRVRLMAGDDEDETRLAGHGQSRMSVFDDSLALAVEHFQTRHNLQEDGSIGSGTLAAMNVTVEDRIETLRLNLDRWRWLPNDLGEKFLLVNIAGFELELVVDDSAVESMSVVVGKTANRTPVFQDTLEYMVVNPYWNVPASITTEEIVPALARDPGYLVRNNYEVMSNGNPVGSSMSAEALQSGAYQVRQTPGPWNALGNVKFLFPNSKDIYLHDTPADHLFTQQSRAFSHGCVRVERPDDLARTLLALLSDRDPSDYDSLRQASGEQWIPFDEKVPVYILYFTAWVDRDGTLRFHEDIYDRDESLEAEREDKLDLIERVPISTEAT